MAVFVFILYIKKEGLVWLALLLAILIFMKRKVACILLTFSLLLNVTLPASAQFVDPITIDPNISIVEDSTDTKGDAPNEDPAPSSPTQTPEDAPSTSDPSTAPPPTDIVDSKQFKINSVSATTNPQPLTSNGGSVSFNVSGSYLNKENIWIKIEKSGQPFQIIPVKKSGFIDSILEAVLPSSNIASLKSENVTLPPSTTETMFVYSVSICHSESTTPPDASSDLWQSCGIAPIEVPRIGDSPSSDDPSTTTPDSNDTTIGSSNPATDTPDTPNNPNKPPEPNAPDQNPAVPDEDDVPVGGIQGDPYPELPPPLMVPGESDTTATPPAEPTEPTKPENSATVSNVTIQTLPDPLTSAGGFAIVDVQGQQLNSTAVWVKVNSTADGFVSSVWKANSSKSDTKVSTDKIQLPANNIAADQIYTVSVMTSQEKSTPEFFDPSWIDMTTITVPKSETPSENNPEESSKDFTIDSVQSTTVPSPLTSAGGTAYVTATGSALDKSKLWIMLDNGKEEIIQKFKDTTSTVASTPEIILPSNESKQDVTYKVSILSSESSTKPRKTDSGWKSFADANIVVPKLDESLIPSIDTVVWEEQASEKEIVTQFSLAGSNFNQGENSLWIKVVPDGSSIGTKIFAANQNVSDSSAQTEVVSLKLKKKSGSDEFVSYKVYAMAKSTANKPSANDDGWNEFSGSSSSKSKPEEEKTDAQPVVTNAEISPSVLPSSGGEVTVTLSGENLEGQKLYIASEPNGSGDTITKQVKADENGTATVTFSIPANENSIETARYATKYQFATSDGAWRSLGTITVGTNMELIVHKYSPEKEPLPQYQFTSDGGYIICFFRNDNPIDETPGASNSRKISVRLGKSGDGETVEIQNGSNSSSGFILIPKNEGAVTQEHVIQVKLPSESIWQTKATVAIPAGKKSASITKIQSSVESPITSEGGSVKVTFTGENLNSQNLFVKLSTGLSGDSDIQEKTVVSEDGTSAEAIIKISKSTSTWEKIYTLYYQIVDGDTPVSNAWIAQKDTFILPPIEATTTIESVVIQVDPSPLTSDGGNALATIKGKNLDKALLHLNLRCTSNSNNDMRLIAESKNITPDKATIEFEIPANTTPVDQVYEVYSAVGREDEVYKNPSAWTKTTSFTVPSMSGLRIISAKSSVPNLTSEGTAISILVEGENLDKGNVWVRVKPNNGDSSSIIQALASTSDKAAATKSFKVGPNLSSIEELIYTVDIAVSKTGVYPPAITDATFNNSVYQFEIIVPKNDISAPTFTTTVTPEALSTDGGDVTVTLNGQNLDKADIYLSIDEAGSTPIKVESTNGTTATAIIPIPANKSMGMDNIYNLYYTTHQTGTDIKNVYAYPTGVWSSLGKTITVTRYLSEEMNIPYILSYQTSPAVSSLKYVEPIEFTFDVVNSPAELTRVWIYQSSEHNAPLSLTRSASTNWVEATVKFDETTAQGIGKATITPWEGLNCFSVYISVDGRNPKEEDLSGQLDNNYGSHHLFDIELKAAQNSDGVKVVGYESTIPPKVAHKTIVELEKRYFPETSSERDLYYLRAVNMVDGKVPSNISDSDIKAQAKQLMNFRNSSTKASSLLEFLADTTVSGDKYMLQISNDSGNTYTNLNSIITVGYIPEGIPTDPDPDPDPNPDPDPDPTPDPTPDPKPDVPGTSEEENSGNTNNGSWYNHITAGDLQNAAKKAEKEEASVITIYATSADTYITSGFFYAAEYYAKDIIINCGKHSWTIKAGTRVARNLDLYYNLGIEYTGKTYETYMQQMAGYDAKILPFYIKYHGVLPAKMLLSITTDYVGGDYAYIYRYNEPSNDVTHIAQPRVTTKAVAAFNMEQCSYYFMSNTPVHSKYERVLYDTLGRRIYDDVLEEATPSGNNSGNRNDTSESDVSEEPVGKTNPSTGA